jgi:hypothetical protein
MIAVSLKEGAEELVNLLLRKGADVNAKSRLFFLQSFMSHILTASLDFSGQV